MEASPHTIVLARTGTTPGMLSGHVAIGLNQVREFDYLALREAPPEIQAQWAQHLTSTLAIHFPESLWVFHELGGPA
jgi:hypothetical protein